MKPTPYASRAVPAWGLLVALVASSCLLTPVVAQDRGLLDQPVFPKNPTPVLRVRAVTQEGVSRTLPGVPEYLWWNGCSPTAAGMVIGWWDAQAGCADLFAGSAATWWGAGDGTTGTKRMVASKEHIAAGKALGLTYGSYENHVANCLADFILTRNGGTYRSYIGPGLVSYCSWLDPSNPAKGSYLATAITRRTTDGWDYAQFCAEIDAGRPVHLGLVNGSGIGHSVTAIGYDNTNGKQNYLCLTTWGGWGLRSWPWAGEAESGYRFVVYAGSYLTVTPKVTNHPPTAPTTLSIAPPNPITTDNLIATAAGSTDPDGDLISYEYEWARSTDGGSNWGGWGWSGATLAHTNTTRGEQWRVRARAGDGKDTGAWAASASVIIANAPPTIPSSVVITPSPRALDNQNLLAQATGSMDPDGDRLYYVYQWWLSADGGVTWTAQGQFFSTMTGNVFKAHTLTTVGQRWKIRAAAVDWYGRAQGSSLDSAVVEII